MTEIAHIPRPAKQSRSREKIERTLETVARLMLEHGDDSFTLHDISREAGVSLSSIYSRVNGKDELIRAVQEQVLVGMEPIYDDLLVRLRSRGVSLRELLPILIDEWAEILRENAPMLRAIMAVAKSYPDVAVRGRSSYDNNKAKIMGVIMEHREEIEAPDPDVAADAAYTICYATLARHLGFGTTSDAAGEGDWTVIKRELGRMAVAYLTRP